MEADRVIVTINVHGKSPIEAIGYILNSSGELIPMLALGRDDDGGNGVSVTWFGLNLDDIDKIRGELDKLEKLIRAGFCNCHRCRARRRPRASRHIRPPGPL